MAHIPVAGKNSGGPAVPENLIVPEVLKVKEAAKVINCSARTLIKLINRGDGPPFLMLGSTMMIRRESLEKWLVKREREARKVADKNKRLVQKFDDTPSNCEAAQG